MNISQLVGRDFLWANCLAPPVRLVNSKSVMKSGVDNMLLRHLSYAIKNHLKAPKVPYKGLWDEMPPTRGISCLSLILYGIRFDSTPV